MPKFTVNIATYNQLPILKKVLESLERQSFKNFETIVCDDGSSDGTLDYFYNHSDFSFSGTSDVGGESFITIRLSSGITYLWQEDKGFRLAKSKNNGIRIAEGEYFLSLEADVIPHKDLLKIYNFWARPATVIYGVRHDILEVPEEVDYDKMDAGIVARDFRLPMFPYLHKADRPWRMCSGCNVLFPLGMLKEVGGWNESFKHYGIDDYEVCLRLAMAGAKFVAAPEAYGYHIKHDLRGTVDENVKILEDLESEFLGGKNASSN